MAMGANALVAATGLAGAGDAGGAGGAAACVGTVLVSSAMSIAARSQLGGLDANASSRAFQSPRDFCQCAGGFGSDGAFEGGFAKFVEGFAGFFAVFARVASRVFDDGFRPETVHGGVGTAFWLS